MDTKPFPAIAEREPSASLIFLFPAQGLYETNRFADPVIWSVAPESTIQEREEWTLTRAACK